MSGAIYQMERRCTLTSEFQHTERYAFIFKVTFPILSECIFTEQKSLKQKKKIQIKVFYLTETYNFAHLVNQKSIHSTVLMKLLFC